MRLKPWQFIVVLAGVLGFITYGIAHFRKRIGRDASDLVGLLPQQSNAITFYVDVALLRSAHILSLVSTPKAQDRDYRSFVDSSGFDYSRDLDAVAGSTTTAETDFILRGSFDWARIQSYVRSHGGACAATCETPASTPGKWASMRLLEPGVIALAVSRDQARANGLGVKRRDALNVPADRVWVTLPAPALKANSVWPLPAQLLAGALHTARSATFSAGMRDSGLRLEMIARFGDQHSAQVARNQLEIDTKMLKLELTREHQSPNPADLTGLLTAGTFQAVSNDVIGEWPVARQLLASLQVD